MPSSQTETSAKFRFVDLFAGLGGFHLAMGALGGECVFASEIREDLQRQYAVNFPGTFIAGDITQIPPSSIPAHDVLCAGFPCQPFSQAGKRQGFNDEKDRGNLFNYIYAILKEHQPQYVILENVPNLKGHDHGQTWNVIRGKLEEDYDVASAILSPHQFGIPQHRKRIYIVCKLKSSGGLGWFTFPSESAQPCDIRRIIDETDANYMPLKSDTQHQLDVWEAFIRQTYAHEGVLPSHPVWAMEFGADYNYEIAPAYQELSALRGCHGDLGREIEGTDRASCLACLPVYARTSSDRCFPQWKRSYISQNRAFYARNRAWLDGWIESIRGFHNSHQKLEWNCGPDATPTLRDKIIQFRASGIRVKKADYVPALNLVGTQIPIFPWVQLPASAQQDGAPRYGRYMTIREAAAVQGMEQLRFDALTTNRAFAALGNAVNVRVVTEIMRPIYG